MKSVFFILSLLIVFSGCDDTGEQLRQQIGEADSMAINYFEGDGTMDTVVAVKIIRDKNSVEILTGFIAGSAISQPEKCGYDGSIHFFKNNQVLQDIYFSSTKEDCRHFLFRLNGRDVTTSLSNEAKDFLNKLKDK